MENYNIDTEQAVLGALILEKDAFDEVATILTPESFYEPFHSLVFATIAGMHRDNKAVDILTILQAIKQVDATIEEPGFKITSLTQRVASAANIVHHALILKDFQIRRDLVYTAQLIEKKANEGADTDELLSLFTERAQAVTDNSVTDGPVNLKDALYQTTEELKAPDTVGLSTGFPRLDTFFGGLKPGRVYVIGGRPGQGKTSVALFMAMANVMRGKQVMFFSAEQDIQDLSKKILSSYSGMGHDRLDRGNLSPQEWQSVDEAISQIERFPGNIYLKDSPKNIQHISAMIRNQKKRTGLELVVIDYLQLVPSINRKKNTIREQEVAEISRTVKQIALSEGIAILELSQLNRDAKGEPKLHHLRESGAIEQDADVVMFVYRPALDGDISYPNEYGQIIIAKNRRGTLGAMDFYNQNMSQFSEQPFNGAPSGEYQQRASQF